MKIIKVLLIIALLVWYFQRSLAGNPAWLTQLPAPKVELSHPASAMVPPPVAFHNPDFCKQYKRQEITGWVLLGVGAGSVAGGSYLIYKGVTDVLNANSTFNIESNASYHPVISQRDVTFLSVGGALGLVGLVLTPTGLALGISGTVRYNKYCGRTSYLISPALDSNGLGISARF